MMNSYLSFKRLIDTRTIVLIALTAAILLIVNFAAGIFAGFIGVPGASGIITGFTVPFFFVLLNKTSKTFGAIIICWVIYSTVAIPMHLMGPPNVFKPIFGFLAALLFEIPVLLLARKNVSYYIGILGYTLGIVGMAYVAFSILNLPGSEKAFKYIWAIAAVFFVEGCISIYVALKSYEKNVKDSRLDRYFNKNK